MTRTAIPPHYPSDKREWAEPTRVNLNEVAGLAPLLGVVEDVLLCAGNVQRTLLDFVPRAQRGQAGQVSGVGDAPQRPSAALLHRTGTPSLGATAP